MDPLDPLTEIINSGQGFSPAIALERIIWAMIGIFFLGAISRSITNSMRSQNWFGRNFLFSYSKDKKITDDTSSQPSGDELLQLIDMKKLLQCKLLIIQE